MRVYFMLSVGLGIWDIVANKVEEEFSFYGV